MANQIGLRLKELREGKGLTQQQLAESAGVSQRTVSHIEQGRNEPTFSTVVALAEVLGVDCRAFTEAPASSAPSPRGRPVKSTDGAEPISKANAPKAKRTRKKG